MCLQERLPSVALDEGSAAFVAGAVQGVEVSNFNSDCCDVTHVVFLSVRLS